MSKNTLSKSHPIKDGLGDKVFYTINAIVLGILALIGIIIRNAVILVRGTTRTVRLTMPLRNSSAPPTTEYFFMSHWVAAISMTIPKRLALTHHGAPPKIVTSR